MTVQGSMSVDLAAPASADERARQRFISKIRRKVLVDLGDDMKRTYADELNPAAERKTGEPLGDAIAVRDAMEDTAIYKFYSSSRYKVQEMVWESVRPQVERNLGTLTDIARETTSDCGGSLRLDPSLDVPRYVSELDVHLMPGCFHTEYQADDVAQGAIYTYGIGVFYGGLPLVRKGSGPAATIAAFIQAAYPDFHPERILDLGCTTGDGTFPYVHAFPDAEMHGIDVGAPLLRYGHARAAAAGMPIHFSQQNAEKMDFPDNSFDVVTSSFFFHELPVKSTQKILKECHRILKPGGLMIHFELPPRSEVDPYLDFYIDWDAYNNNEPYYSAFRRQSLTGLCEEAGFSPDNYIQRQMFNLGTVSDDQFAAAARGEIKVPVVLNGATWFIFGAQK
ncbi:MAG: class I SAM-dependent methyltransferase [Sphingobium sp.]